MILSIASWQRRNQVNDGDIATTVQHSVLAMLTSSYLVLPLPRKYNFIKMQDDSHIHNYGTLQMLLENQFAFIF
jgi:hypothetical protein